MGFTSPHDGTPAAAPGRCGAAHSPAGEWLLDNFHLVEERIALVKRHPPRGYSRELLRLALVENLRRVLNHASLGVAALWLWRTRRPVPE